MNIRVVMVSLRSSTAPTSWKTFWPKLLQQILVFKIEYNWKTLYIPILEFDLVPYNSSALNLTTTACLNMTFSHNLCLIWECYLFKIRFSVILKICSLLHWYSQNGSNWQSYMLPSNNNCQGCTLNLQTTPYSSAQWVAWPLAVTPRPSDLCWCSSLNWFNKHLRQ